MYYVIIAVYFSVGLILLFLTPLVNTAKSGYDDLVKDYFKSEKYTEKLIGVFGLFAFAMILLLVLCIFPIVILSRYLSSKNLGANKKHKDIVTERITDPTYNRIIEERDYKKTFKKKLVEIRRFKYDSKFRLEEISHFDHTEKLLLTIKNYYNALGQKYAVTAQRPDDEYPNRSFYLFDSQNRHIAHYGELDSGHQYCHEFVYDDKGEKHTTNMLSLRRDIDLQEIFQNALKRQEEKTKPKIIFPRNASSRGNSVRPWNCDICDGDETTGCLYHDPSECPEFT